MCLAFAKLQMLGKAAYSRPCKTCARIQRLEFKGKYLVPKMGSYGVAVLRCLRWLPSKVAAKQCEVFWTDFAASVDIAHVLHEYRVCHQG